jgi:Tol biopolymer transport system component
LNLADNSIQELDVNEAVVGESVVWSPDGTKIAYVTLNGVAKYNIKLADLKQNTSTSIGSGYLVTFSSSGKSLVYASYEIDKENELEKKQVIYRMNIEKEKIEKVWDFPESSVFSRSINMLYWVNSKDTKE